MQTALIAGAVGLCLGIGAAGLFCLALRQMSRHCARRALTSLDHFITENYGDACPDFEPECPTCAAWERRDEIAFEICMAAGLDTPKPIPL